MVKRYFISVEPIEPSGVAGAAANCAHDAESAAAALPIGVHFLGRFGDEASLIRLASQLEQARPWAKRTPPISVIPQGVPA